MPAKSPSTAPTKAAKHSAKTKAKASPKPKSPPLVGIIMGSISDWETMENAAKLLADFGVPFETKVVSAHRTPQLLYSYATSARKRGLRVIIAGAGGAAHLPGMTASLTDITVHDVPVESKALKGMDSLLSIVQMPGGVPVATFAIGKAGAVNAALFAISILALHSRELATELIAFRDLQTEKVIESQSQLPE